MKILIVEDDERLALPLKEDLEHQHFTVTLAGDGHLGFQLATQEMFDIILLDVMLPVVDGVTVCQNLRRSGVNSIVIMISARNKTESKIAGLDSGADDYVTKPFEVDELSARIRAVLRRRAETRSPLLTCGELVLDPDSNVVNYCQHILDLTPTEYRLLEHFMRTPGRTYSKEELIDRLWSMDGICTKDVIKTHIKGLRNKLVACGAPRDLILTVYGFGYRLKNCDK